jgi:glycosyltransferase involved in cell wall biosynthesis
MKVVVLSSGHGAQDPRIFLKQCVSLREAGHEVVFVVPHNQNEVVKGIQIQAIPRPRSRLERIAITPWKVLRAAIGLRANIYHFHDPELIPIGLILRALGKKVVYDAHEDLPQDTLDKSWIPIGLRRIVSWLLRSLENIAVHQYSGVITVNEIIATRFRRCNSKTIVINNYPIMKELPYDVSNPILRYSSKKVVNFGGISKFRCIQEIVEASDLLPRHANVRFIVGGGTDSTELLAQISRLPGWRGVQYVGSVSRREMFSILAESAIAIILYSNTPNHYQVGSNRLFESLGMGLPVITSNFPAWIDLVEGNDCGICVDPENPECIANAIQYLISNPQVAAEKGRRGRSLAVERFNWEVEGPRLLRFYENLNHRVPPDCVLPRAD